MSPIVIRFIGLILHTYIQIHVVQSACSDDHKSEILIGGLKVTFKLTVVRNEARHVFDHWTWLIGDRGLRVHNPMPWTYGFVGGVGVPSQVLFAW
eukprot:2337850-Amphidinium_carterae.1